MAEIRTANIAKLVTKQAGRAKEKVGPKTILLLVKGLKKVFLDLETVKKRSHVWFQYKSSDSVGTCCCLRSSKT